LKREKAEGGKKGRGKERGGGCVMAVGNGCP